MRYDRVSHKYLQRARRLRERELFYDGEKFKCEAAFLPEAISVADILAFLIESELSLSLYICTVVVYCIQLCQEEILQVMVGPICV